MLIGYARVSTGDQSLTLQIDALEEAGCEWDFQDQVSGISKYSTESQSGTQFRSAWRHLDYEEILRKENHKSFRKSIDLRFL